MAMERHWAYCSACDRQVEVVLKPVGQTDPATGRPAEIICLEVGHTCTGALCPITDVPPERMREALENIRASDPANGEE
ncbi:MAG: hypothetical protein Q8W45_04230 [Candidatus Palauibacterales bacterium]|nr:hypothetical protein [Candidatus Palauibacterales bacterium]MDP2482471.1 hypothetical protein [Candidatus Palauibacterales bacterium]